MTPEQLLDACGEHRLIIHRGQVFINTRDPEEAEHWRKRRCGVNEWYSERELRRGLPQGWEVGLWGALTPVWETNEDGDEVNVAKQQLLTLARERMGV
jgi:hypothetical protein